MRTLATIRVRLAVVALAVVALASAAACGGARTRPEPSAAYQRIREHESRLDEGARLVLRDPSERERAVALSCPAADEICAIAESLEEQDALIRCDRARRTCESVRGSGSARARR